jgi:hypothetical protein
LAALGPVAHSVVDPLDLGGRDLVEGTVAQGREDDPA